MPLRFEKITTHKKRFLDLLLLADEQESMIDRYLERGEMFVARDDGQVVAECVVTDEADRIGEIKNLAVPLQYQRKGYGRQTLEFLEAYYRERYRTLLVGTGDVPRTLRFYERCGYVRSHSIPGFFTDHYDHPIIEDGRQLVDMVYLRSPCNPAHTGSACTKIVHNGQIPPDRAIFYRNRLKFRLFLIPSRQDNYETHS